MENCSGQRGKQTIRLENFDHKLLVLSGKGEPERPNVPKILGVEGGFYRGGEKAVR